MKLTKEEIREIIEDEIVVDCYDDEEVNMGWETYLLDNITYPFKAEYLLETKSGEKLWKKVEVISDEATKVNFSLERFYVKIKVNDIIVLANMDGLQNIEGDEETEKAVQVWQGRMEC